MNIVLLRELDWVAHTTVVLRDYRAKHLLSILKVIPGQTVRVGLINGKSGLATVVSVSNSEVSLEVELRELPRARHPIQIILALPRPKMLRRIFRSVAEFGVGELHLIHSYRVEKSFWQSPFLSQDKVETALIQGMERSGDTVMPRIFQHRRFKPFIQDQLADVAQGRQVLLAHPGKHATPNADSAQPRAVLIGPEGGFIDYEVALAQGMGATVVSLGDRILSVDTAICAVLARELG